MGSNSSFAPKLLLTKNVVCQWDQEVASPKCLLWKWTTRVQGQLPPHSVFFYFSPEAKEVFEVHCAMISGSYQNHFHIESQMLIVISTIGFVIGCDWLVTQDKNKWRFAMHCSTTLTVFNILMKVNVWWMHCGVILCSLCYSWSWILNWIIGSISCVIMFYCLYLCSSLTVQIFASTWFHRHQVINLS